VYRNQQLHPPRSEAYPTEKCVRQQDGSREVIGIEGRELLVREYTDAKSKSLHRTRKMMIAMKQDLQQLDASPLIV